MIKKDKNKIEKEIGLGEPKKLIEEVFKEIAEKKEEGKEVLSEEEELIRKKIEREIELIKTTKEEDEVIEKKAQKIKQLDAQAKIKKLLVIAKEDGVSFAVKIAQKLNDPYILDIFHDILVSLINKGKKFKK